MRRFTLYASGMATRRPPVRRAPGQRFKCEREGCGRETTTLRRGMCDRCYQREWRGVQLADTCEACACADPRVLGRRRMPDETVGETWRTLCANCIAIAGKRYIPLATLRLEVRWTGRERRGTVTVAA